MLRQCRALWLAGAVAASAAVISPVVMAQAKPIEQTWTVNFKDSDIHEVIKFVADVTGKTIVIDSRVKGRITVLSQEPKNKKDLYGLFRSILEVNNYTVVEVGDVVRIVPIKDARTSPITVNKAEKLVGDDSEYVTEVIQLKNVEAAKVLPVLRPLIPQHSHFAAYSPSNAIVVSDTIANIERVRAVIEQIDKAALPTTEVIQLKYAAAEDMVSTLKKLRQEGAKAAGGASASSNSLVMVADKRNNAILLSGEDVQRERIKSLIRRLDRPQQQTGNVRVIYLEYAKATEVAEVLTKVVQNLSKLKPGGDAGSAGAESGATVEADESTNALLLMAEGDMLNSLLAVVERLDVRRAQVLIEAIIVEIQAGDNRGFGIEWLFQNQDAGAIGASATGGGGIGDVAAGVFSDAEDALTALAGAMVSAARGGTALALGGDVAGEEFLALATFLDSDSRTNILSTPTLLTLDNNEASISVGQNVPFITGSFTSSNNSSTNPFQTIQREDVGINLTVTPHINAGDQIILDISQEVSSLAEEEQTADVVTNQSRVETQVLAKDQNVIVLGGMIQENLRQVERRVPILGRIPLVGRLFRSSTTDLSKSHLMVFIKPTIIRDDQTLVGATAEKYRRIREDQIKLRDRGVFGLGKKAAPLLKDLKSFEEDLIREGADLSEDADETAEE